MNSPATSRTLLLLILTAAVCLAAIPVAAAAEQPPPAADGRPAGAALQAPRQPDGGNSQKKSTASTSEAAAEQDGNTNPPPIAEHRHKTPIRPGDFIVVTVKEDGDVTFDGEVSAGGLITLPYLGRVFVAGKTETRAEALLKAALEKNLYVTATVSVTVVKHAPGHVYIYGAVTAPGRVDLPEIGTMTVLQALAEVKGLSTWAAPRDAYVVRTPVGEDETVKVPVNLAKAFENIGGPDDLPLQANDVIFIPTRRGANSEAVLSNEPVEVIVAGEVAQPGIVQFAPGEERTLVRAIFKAGNFTRFAKRSAVKLIRYQDGGERNVRKIDTDRIIDEGYLSEDVNLEPGDMIIVPEKRINF